MPLYRPIQDTEYSRATGSLPPDAQRRGGAESALPNDYSLLRSGIRHESELVAPVHQPGEILNTHANQYITLEYTVADPTAGLVTLQQVYVDLGGGPNAVQPVSLSEADYDQLAREQEEARLRTEMENALRQQANIASNPFGEYVPENYYAPPEQPFAPVETAPQTVYAPSQPGYVEAAPPTVENPQIAQPVPLPAATAPVGGCEIITQYEYDYTTGQLLEVTYHLTGTGFEAVGSAPSGY